MTSRDVSVMPAEDQVVTTRECDPVLVPGQVTTGPGGGCGQSSNNAQYEFILNVIIVPIVFGLITFVGVIGNCLVIYVILSRERMRTVTNLLLLNLAIADLFFVLFIPSVTAYQFATEMWQFGEIACKLMHYTVNVTAYITVYTLVLVSIVRYMTIVHGARTAGLRTRRNVTLAIVFIWVVMLAVNTPVLSCYSVELGENGTLNCQHSSKEVGQVLFTTFFVFSYVLPLTIIALFSVCILLHIMKHRSQILGTRNRSANKKKRAGMLLILVVVVFAILWLPIHIHLLVAFWLDASDALWYQAIMVLWYCLAYFNSCVNPIIYNHASKDFRDAFHDVACCGGASGGGGVGGGGGRLQGRGLGGGGGGEGVARRAESDEERTEGVTGAGGITNTTQVGSSGRKPSDVGFAVEGGLNGVGGGFGGGGGGGGGGGEVLLRGRWIGGGARGVDDCGAIIEQLEMCEIHK